jgi:NPCBM-associated, NEW3 domain of alpha-galactosidase/Outer membrane efflux protein
MRLLLLALLVSLSPASGQPVAGSSFTTEQQKVLELKKLELTLKNARGRYERARKLYDNGLSTVTDLNQAEVEYRQSEVSFQQTFLQLFADVPRVSFVSAVKSQAPDGRKLVRLTIRNTSGAVMDYKAFGIDLSEVAVPDELKLRELTNISVSLREYTAVGAGGAGPIISSPYEAIIPVLPVGKENELQFTLLKDVDAVSVSMTYAGKVDQREVFLEKDASANIVSITSAGFSQEADLGSQATYDLSLEQFTRAASSFRLAVLNLPRQVNYEFIDPATQARLFQVRFPEGVTSLKLQLRLSLPDKNDETVALDRALGFWVAVADSEQLLVADKAYSPAELVAMKCGKVRLELIPRGVGRLEVSAPSLYQEIKPGETVALNVTVKNSGTRRIDNVHVSTESPINWRSQTVPDVIPVLEPNREEIIKLSVVPAADVGVGDFEIRIKTDAIANNRKVQTEDKVDRIHVSSAAGLKSTLWLLGFLLLLVTGIVVFGVKVTRR